MVGSSNVPEVGTFKDEIPGCLRRGFSVGFLS